MAVIAFNDPYGNKFGVSISGVNPLYNSLYPGIEFELVLTHMQNGPFQVSNPIGHVRIVSGEGYKRFAGDLYFQFNAGELDAGKETMATSAHLVLDPFKISQIEKIRANKEIKMILNLQFTIVKRDRQIIRYSSTTGMPLESEIAQSTWIGEFLPSFNYKEVQLLEIPKIQSDIHVRLIEYLDRAWRYNYMGQYDVVLLNCRKIIEELDNILKDKGFSKKKSIDDERDITVADWRGFLNQGEVGKYVEDITDNIRRFCNRAAHSGKAIAKEDADYALLATHATINLVLWNIEKQELFS